MPLWTAGSHALTVLAQAFLAGGTALVLALLYALRCETSRRSFGPARGKTLLFILCTPATGGMHVIVTFFVCLVILYILLEGLHTFLVVAVKGYLGLWFPFWGIGLGLLDGSWLPGLLCGTLSAAVCSALLLRGETHRLRRSLRGYLEDSGQRERQSTKRRQKRRTAELLESALGGEEYPRGAGPARPLTPSFSRRLFHHTGAVERWALRASGENPLLAKTFLERRAPPFPLLPIFSLIAILVLAILFTGTASESLRYSRPLARFALGCTLVGMLPSLCRATCRIAPPGSRPGFRDAILSSPLGSGRVIVGVLFVGLVRIWPLLLAVVVPSILLFRGVSGWVPTLALVVSILLVGTALALWMAFLWKRMATRVAATGVLVALLLVPPLFLPSDSTPPELRPLPILLASDTGAIEILRAAGSSTLLAVVLFALFTGCFDRLVGRK